MPSRQVGTHRFSIEQSRSKPTAAISPGTQSKVIGALIKLDGRGSVSPDGDELTYAWEILETPLGSTLEVLTSTEEDDSVITFVPDMTGEYTVGLKVATPYRESEQVTATVEIQTILTPYTLRTTPQGGALMFKVISSFWRLVEERQVYDSLWSGYMQAVAADLLRLFQVDYAKSIKTIQPLFQRRWLLYSPKLELDAALHSGIYGHHQSGSEAFTASGSVAAVGIIVSSTEVVLLDGTPTSEAIGEDLEIYTSGGDPGNIGSYTINRLNTDESGYIISASTPFPAASDEVLDSGSDLVTFTGDDEVYVSDVSADFTALGVAIGDVLRISDSADSGYYRISGVGTADGLTNDRTLKLESAPLLSRSGVTYTIFKSLRILAQRTAAPDTNTVYLPESEADLTVFETSELKGTGSVESVFEIVVEERHVFSALVGQRITITSGTDGGKSFTIAGVNEANTGYLVGSALSATSFPEEVSYEIPMVTDITSRVLVLEDRAYEIESAKLDESGPSVGEGGPGTVWVVTLTKTAAPAGRENLSWRIAAAIESTEFEDFEEQGVAAGDLLMLEVVRTDNQKAASLPCTVLGAVNNKIAFDIGTTELTDGTNGALTNAEIYELAQGLLIPRVAYDPVDEDELLITLTAEEIRTLLNSLAFQTDYHNLPLSSSTDIDLESYTVRVRTAHIIRNCRIPVDETVESVPALFEYIDEPQYGEDDDGKVWLVGKDGSLTELDREPLELLENRDYSVSSEGSVTGTNLETAAGSFLLKIPNADLIDRDIRVGDYVDIESGFDQGRYFIQAIYDSETVKAATAEGAGPDNTATGLSFTLKRRTEGNFLRFVEGMFTADVPAPEHLWAQTTLFDNSDYIEDNFGALVGVTREQLDEYGGSQISYKGAVTALMYAWANGPTVKNVTTGCHVLVGLPVTEVAGTIIQIDPEYDTSDGTGRILVEDIDHEGNGTGLVRIYYYPATEDEDTLSDFAGLATNPATGAPFETGDVVLSFQTLSKSVLVSDYINNPAWWTIGGATGEDELKKYHSWQVELDAHQVDSRDVQLVYDFAMGIRPIYTKPDVVLVLYLYGEVTVEDSFKLEADLLLADDPSLSTEATHMVDSYNGSSLAQRILDHGSLATRTLFEGRDLVTSAGSSTVTSARGGFSATLDETPLSHAPEDPVGKLAINEWFEDEVYVRGTPLVKPDDILFIREGVNRGRYKVVGVTDDNTLEVAALPGWPPRTRPTAEIEAATEQVFQIQRQDSAEITDGQMAVESYDAAEDVTVVEDTQALFRWDGVAAGDLLVVESGADYGVHEIVQVGKIDGFGDVESLEHHLTISGELTEAGNFAYTVRREHLRTNPLVSRSDGNTTAGSSTFTVDDGGLFLENLRYGDLLTCNVDSEKVFKIIDVVDDNTLVLDQEFSSTEPGLGVVSVDYVIFRPELFEQDGLNDHDIHVERLVGYDDVEIVLIEPVTSHSVVADLALTADTATSAATNLEASGVTVGMKLEIANTHENSGAYLIEAVDGDEVTIESSWLADEDPVTGTFLELDDAWSVENDEVTLTGTLNLEFGPMMSTSTPDPQTATFTNGSAMVTGALTSFSTLFQVGDVVRLQGDGDLDYAKVLEVVSDVELTLDRAYTGTGGAGLIERGTPGGLVIPGDQFTCDEGTFVVKAVQAATMTLTASTGVSPAANRTGRVTRKL